MSDLYSLCTQEPRMSRMSKPRTFIALSAALALSAMLFAPVSLLPAALAQFGTPPRPTDPKLLPPDHTAPFADFSSAWPDRWQPPNAAKSDRPFRGVIRIMNVFADRLGTRGNPSNAPLTDDDRADIAALLGPASKPDGTPVDASLEIRREGQGSLVHVERRVDVAIPSNLGQLGGVGNTDAALVLRFISAERVTTGDRTALELQRTTFAYYEPEPATPTGDAGAAPDAEKPAEKPTNPTAVILLMPGLFGTPEQIIEPMIARFRQSGWGVLRMMSQPSRFTERVNFTVDVSSDAATVTSAAEISRVLSGRAAECAYAVQAAWEFLEQSRPEIKGVPRGAVGMSGGAMTMPTVVALDPAPYSAIMMIAGGADYWLINEHSNYAEWIGAIKRTWIPEKPTDDQRRALDAAYLAASPLDPFHTAAALKGKRIVMMHATGDRAVPAKLGDVLWERLGRPERWAGPWTHETIFISLATQLDQVIDWFQRSLHDK
jgi:hypothetical protein